jgi:hypothetical protein
MCLACLLRSTDNKVGLIPNSLTPILAYSYSIEITARIDAILHGVFHKIAGFEVIKFRLKCI